MIVIWGEIKIGVLNGEIEKIGYGIALTGSCHTIRVITGFSST